MEGWKRWIFWFKGDNALFGILLIEFVLSASTYNDQKLFSHQFYNYKITFVKVYTLYLRIIQQGLSSFFQCYYQMMHYVFYFLIILNHFRPYFILYFFQIMLQRLLNSLAFNFYKTKWIHPIPKKKANKPLQTIFKKWTIVRGDIVKVRTGDDRGKVGKVVKVLRKLNRIVVRGVNIRQYSKIKNEKKVKLKKSSSIHISNVGLYDSSIKKAVKVRIAYHPDTGQSLRISKKTGRILHKSRTQRHKRQKRGKKRKIGLKDTPALIAHKVTYMGQDFAALRRQFEQFIAQKEERQKHLVFRQ